MRPTDSAKSLGILILALTLAAATASVVSAAIFQRTCCPSPTGAFFGYHQTDWRVGLPVPAPQVAADPMPFAPQNPALAPVGNQPPRPSATGTRSDFAPEPARPRAGLR